MGTKVDPLVEFLSKGKPNLNMGGNMGI